MDVGMDPIMVSTAVPLALDESSFYEITEDPLARSFGDADLVGDVSEPGVGTTGNGEKDLGVIGQKAPTPRLFT